MKRGVFYMLMAALILSYFDGIMTYIWISTECVYEVEPINYIIQKSAGLNSWLVPSLKIVPTDIGTIFYLFIFNFVKTCKFLQNFRNFYTPLFCLKRFQDSHKRSRRRHRCII